MKQFINGFLAIILLTFFNQPVFSQSEPQKMSLKVDFQPLYLAWKIVKLGVEVKPQNKIFSYIVSPEIFHGKVYDASFLSLIPVSTTSTDYIKGFGIGIHQKISSKETSRETPYLSYGVTYRKNSISYSGEGYLPYSNNGLEYYEYGDYTDKLKINAVLVNVVAGIQLNTKRMLFDWYLGAGYKSSSKKSTYPTERRYDHSMPMYAYNGFGLNLGMKVGLIIF